ncbi:hypothetical protein JFU49_08055 [Pseudomonas sp. TH03]|nr:hypothetical protein [Pseudomonas sp. TH03]
MQLMSSRSPDTPKIGRAEAAFAAAFERLKFNAPKILSKGSPVTQNNVAREAGLDSSALKKSRFPSLIAQIQDWVEENARPAQAGQSQRSSSRGLRERFLAMKAQRDNALSLLASADALILELLQENARLQAGRPLSNVSPLRAG